mmetsp:Transcript_32017/g.95897  ORF Transcript_32017/g.95897 Transcript_32017/m.95897 type:complete len:225 (-) Transcript_32017:527-1201(-)
MRASLRCFVSTVALLVMSATVVTAQGTSQTNNIDVMTVCPNGHQCDRGERCTRMGTALAVVKDLNGLEGFLCGCEGRAGLPCETADEVFCVRGSGASSTNNFCVNGGVCTSLPSLDDVDVLVAGCLCTDDFEGEHCQFPRGEGPTPPPDNTTDVLDESEPPQSGASVRSVDDGGGLGTGAIVGISVGAFVVTICLACIVKRVFSKDNDPPSVVVGDEQGGEQEF